MQSQSHEVAHFLVHCLGDIHDKIVTVVTEEREGEEDDITLIPGEQFCQLWYRILTHISHYS
jgi:hypothetical protein